MDLPMTPRMISRGYTSASLNNDTLRNMDLSYYQLDASSNMDNSDRRSKGQRGQLITIHSPKYTIYYTI